jgi:hypothetical protein
MRNQPDSYLRGDSSVRFEPLVASFLYRSEAEVPKCQLYDYIRIHAKAAIQCVLKCPWHELNLCRSAQATPAREEEPLRHIVESGNPGPRTQPKNLDPRFRGDERNSEATETQLISL